MRMYCDRIVRITSPSLSILSSFFAARQGRLALPTFSNRLQLDLIRKGSAYAKGLVTEGRAVPSEPRERHENAWRQNRENRVSVTVHSLVLARGSLGQLALPTLFE